jgi:hypothetical protein
LGHAARTAFASYSELCLPEGTADQLADNQFFGDILELAAASIWHGWAIWNG